jgi:hypothetical protein
LPGAWSRPGERGFRRDRYLIAPETPGGFTNEVQHVEFLSPVAARLASPVVHCFMIGAAVKGDPQERGARAHP